MVNKDLTEQESETKNDGKKKKGRIWGRLREKQDELSLLAFRPQKKLTASGAEPEGVKEETYNCLLGLRDTLRVNQHGLLGQSTPVITDP